MKFYHYLSIILFLISCNNQQPNENKFLADFDNAIAPHPLCNSMFCTLDGKSELILLYGSSINSKKQIKYQIQPVFVVDSARKFSATKKDLQVAISDLNNAFKTSKITFHLLTKIDTVFAEYSIDNIYDHIKDFIKTSEKIEKENTINLYIIKHYERLNGVTPVLTENFSNYPSAKINRLFISDIALKNHATINHEFGHFFGLQHTFGNSPMEASTLEKTDASNCKTEGDFICDTPADPCGYIDCCNCLYIGLSDKKKHDYQPHINNYMSYYKSECKNTFTKEQLSGIHKFAISYRNYLK